MESDHERRDNVRSEVSTLACTTTQDGNVVLLEVVDISAGGLRVRLGGATLAMGEEVNLELEVDGEPFDAKAKIVNLTPKEAGLRFTEIDPDNKVLIETFIASDSWF